MMDSLAWLGTRIDINDILTNSKSVVNFKNCILNETIEGYQGFSSSFITANEINIKNSSFNTDFTSTVDDPPSFIKGYFGFKNLNITNSIFKLDTAKFLNRPNFFDADTIALHNSLFTHTDCISLLDNDNIEFICDSTNIFGVNPVFTDPINGDFSLPFSSMAIDAGNNNFLSPVDSLDYYGQARISNGIVDIGAYELQILPFSLSTDSIQSVSCPGGSDGQVYFTLSGVPPFIINWQKEDESTGVGTTGLSAGQYTFTITDAFGQTESTIININEPPTFFLSFNTSAVSCQGATNGLATVIPNGGIPPYSYLWNTGNTEAMLVDLSEGTYTVTVTDHNGCKRVASAILEEPGALEVNFMATNPSCFDGQDGQLIAIPDGGTAPYTVHWQNGLINDTLSNISAETYYYTITDINGCTLSDSTILMNPVPLSVNMESISPSCHDSQDGQLIAIPDGGTPPYEFSWDNGVQEDTLSMVGFGLYTLELTDANDCETTNSVVLSVPLPLSYSSSITDASCWNSIDGAVSIIVNGGQSPYSYAWNTGDHTSWVDSLSAGTYEVTIQDANTCTDSLQFIVEAPDSISAVIEVQAATSINPPDGVAFVEEVSGGTSPYSFLWSNGSTSPYINELASGEYSLTITDENNCTSVYFIFVDLLQSSSTLTNSTTIPIYPNPTIGTLFIHFPMSQRHQIYLYNSSGKKVFQSEGQGLHQYELPFPTGLYSYRIIQKGIDIQNGKLLLIR